MVAAIGGARLIHHSNVAPGLAYVRPTRRTTTTIVAIVDGSALTRPTVRRAVASATTISVETPALISSLILVTVAAVEMFVLQDTATKENATSRQPRQLDRRYACRRMRSRMEVSVSIDSQDASNVISG